MARAYPTVPYDGRAKQVIGMIALSIAWSVLAFENGQAYLGAYADTSKLQPSVLHLPLPKAIAAQRSLNPFYL